MNDHAHEPLTRAVVIGLSAGGMQALSELIPALPDSFPWPLIIVQHIGEQSDGFLAEFLNSKSPLNVKEAEDKEPVRSGSVYLAPAGYHLLIEEDFCFSLTIDARVNFSCPSIDVLFESAADAYKSGLIGVIMTGANSDGARGLLRVKERGGLTIVQNPETALASAMPRAALERAQPAHCLDLQAIAPFIVSIAAKCEGSSHDRELLA